jgi:hypothetical protein
MPGFRDLSTADPEDIGARDRKAPARTRTSQKHTPVTSFRPPAYGDAILTRKDILDRKSKVRECFAK